MRKFPVRFPAAFFRGGILLSLALTPSCRRLPETYQLRYRFRPDETLSYAVSFSGEGKAVLSTTASASRQERIDLPVTMRGTVILELKVNSVSEAGVADLALTFKDFEAEINSQVRERKDRLVLNREGLKKYEGSLLIKEAGSHEEDFPLRGFLDTAYRMQVDSRGQIAAFEAPSQLAGNFPHPDFRELIEHGLPVFPERPVVAGESWEHVVSLSMPEVGKPWDRGQSWKLQIFTTLTKVERDSAGEVAELGISGSIEQEWSGPEAEKLEAGGIKGFRQKLSGEASFDLTGGRLVSAHTILDQKFDLFMVVEKVVKGSGFDVTVEFNLTVDQKLKGM